MKMSEIYKAKESFEKLEKVHELARQIHNMTYASDWTEAEEISYLLKNKMAVLVVQKILKDIFSIDIKLSIYSVSREDIENECIDGFFDYNDDSSRLVTEILEQCGFTLHCVDIEHTVKDVLYEVCNQDYDMDYIEFEEGQFEQVLDMCQKEIQSTLDKSIYEIYSSTIYSFIFEYFQKTYCVHNLDIYINQDMGRILWNAERMNMMDKPEIALLLEAGNSLKYAQFIKFDIDIPCGYSDDSFLFVMMDGSACETAEFVNYLHISWGYVLEAAICKELINIIKVKYPVLLSKEAVTNENVN